MATLKDLINDIDINDMQYQILTRGNTTLTQKGKNDKYLEVKFESNPSNMNKEAIIIWVEKDKLNDSLKRVSNPA